MSQRNIRLSNQKGISLVELITAIGIAGLVAASALMIQSIFVTQQQQQNTFAWAFALSSLAYQNATNNQAWTRTLADPGNDIALQCIRNHQSCLGRQSSIRLVGSSGEIVTGTWDPSQPDAGLDLNGQPCTGFSLTGSDTCPFRYVISWTPLCTGACVEAQVQIQGELLYYPSHSESRPLFAPARYGFTTTIGSVARDGASACLMVGGNFDAISGVCAVGPAGQCPANRLLLGFNPDGTLICGQMDPIRCPSFTVLNSIDTNGNYRCDPGCRNGTSSASGTVTFTAR